MPLLKSIHSILFIRVKFAPATPFLGRSIRPARAAYTFIRLTKNNCLYNTMFLLQQLFAGRFVIYDRTCRQTNTGGTENHGTGFQLFDQLESIPRHSET